MIKNLPVILKTLLLFLGLLYALIPFETSKAILIHSAALMFVIGYALYVGNFKIKINHLGRIILLMFTILTLMGLLISSEADGLIFTFAIVFGSITASMIHYNPKFRHLFFIAFKWLVIFSIAMLFLQTVILTITGKVLPIHEFIFPFSEARIGTYTNFEGLYRMGGLYIEPGTYANMMYLFLIIYLVISKNTFSPVLFIGAISIILSYSVWGMIFGSYLLIILIIAKLKKITWKIKLIILLILALTSFFSFNYISNYIDQSQAIQFASHKINVSHGSAESKMQAFHKYEETFGDFLIIGEGFYPEFNKGLSSVQDAGFLLNVSVVFGILFAICIFTLYIYLSLKYYTWVGAAASLPIFISKIFYYDAAFWLLFFLVIYGGAKLKLDSN